VTLTAEAPTTGSSTAAHSAAKKRRKRSETRAGYAFLSPWLLGFVLLTAGPMLASLYLAFTNYNLFAPPQWIGLENFQRLFHDPNYAQAWKVTLTYVVLGTPIKLLAALAVAMLLNNAFSGKGFYRSSFYAPSLIGASVSIAIVWKAMFIDKGIVDQVQQFFGFPAGGWVGDPARTMPMLILLTVWQFGAPMVIFLAGLKQIPVELYEAAAVDGAGAWRIAWSIKIPALRPALVLCLIFSVIGSFQLFTEPQLMQRLAPSVIDSAYTPNLYAYTLAFTGQEVNYAAAVSFLLGLVIVIASYTVLIATNRKARS